MWRCQQHPYSMGAPTSGQERREGRVEVTGARRHAAQVASVEWRASPVASPGAMASAPVISAAGHGSARTANRRHRGQLSGKKPHGGHEARPPHVPFPRCLSQSPPRGACRRGPDAASCCRSSGSTAACHTATVRHGPPGTGSGAVPGRGWVLRRPPQVLRGLSAARRGGKDAECTLRSVGWVYGVPLRRGPQPAPQGPAAPARSLAEDRGPAVHDSPGGSEAGRGRSIFIPRVLNFSDQNAVDSSPGSLRERRPAR